jgi:phospholipase C
MEVSRLRKLTTVCAVLVLTGLSFAGPSGASNLVASAVAAPVVSAGTGSTGTSQATITYHSSDDSAAAGMKTVTPIKHLVVIFQENVSFDHYFATYPHALNPAGEPRFTPAENTASALTLESAGLLSPNNPNSAQPFRLDRTQALTCDMNHDYTPEQQAVDGGLLDKFVEYTDGSGGSARQYCPKGVVMGYYDGNTVTALWNYAQHFAMDDQSFGTGFGPSTPGVLNLVAGDTGGAACGHDTHDANTSVYKAPMGDCSPTNPPPTSGAAGPAMGTVIGDPDQYYDDWSSGGFGSKNTAAMVNPNIGDLLNAKGITWGWFNGGFDTNPSHPVIAFDRYIGIDPSTDKGTSLTDYSAHHEGFQYFASTANPHHLPPASAAMIGRTDQANHQYDLTDFFTAANAGNLPAVSYLKAPRYQDGHPGYSDPLDEQQFLVETINHLMSLPSWKSTAIIISYDDSDGWYDHITGPIVNRSNTPLDVNCGASNDGAPGRCGYGPRLPFLVISPYARANYIDHSVTDQTSSLRFIEDNWLGGQRLSSESLDNRAGMIISMFDWTQHRPDKGRLLLNPTTGNPY